MWEQVFAGPLRGPVTAVLCTHFHADHCGLATTLTERWRAPLLMTHDEYFTRMGWPGDWPEVPWQHAQFYRQAGYPEEMIGADLGAAAGLQAGRNATALLPPAA